MIKRHYVCPICGEYSGNMMPISKSYRMSEYEKEIAPKLSPMFPIIGNEVLQCTCGLKLTWFLMKAVDKEN